MPGWFQTFATAIDTPFPRMGWRWNAQFSTIDGETVSEVEVPDDLVMKVESFLSRPLRSENSEWRTPPLNYARFRKDDEGDFGQTRRQQVMSAIVHQIRDPNKLFGSWSTRKGLPLWPRPMYPSPSYSASRIGLIQEVPAAGLNALPFRKWDWVDAYDMYGGQRRWSFWCL